MVLKMKESKPSSLIEKLINVVFVDISGGKWGFASLVVM